MSAATLLKRAQELGPAMVGFRLRQRLQRGVAGMRAGLLGPRKIGAAPAPDWDRTAFFFPPADREALRGALPREFPGAFERVEEEARAALRGDVTLLTGQRHSFGARVDWHADPRVAAPAWPVRHFTELDVLRLDEPCDIKIPWEVGRGIHLFRMAQAYWLSGDPAMAAGAAAGLEDFLLHNPPEFGPQWVNGMEVGLRLIHWIWTDRLCAGSAAFGPALRSRLWWGIREGARYIARFPEREEVSGNHFWFNGLGLWYAGRFLGRSGEALARQGRSIVVAELWRQTRPDGTSFEQSTGYHRLVTELMLHGLLLARLEGRPCAAEVQARVRAMLLFAAETLHPGGSAPLLGDHDDGRVLSFSHREPWDHLHLLAVGGALFAEREWTERGREAGDEALWLMGANAPLAASGPRTPARDSRAAAVGFRDGGFYVLRGGPVHSVWDAGPLGKRGNGVHGHADTLSGEVSVDGIRLLVDSGTWGYSADPARRNRYRGTAAHNLIQLDGRELAEPGAGRDLWKFLSAVPFGVEDFGEAEEGGHLSAWHDGYTRFWPGVRVRREVALERDGSRLRVLDRVQGDGRHQAVLRWHLAPLGWAWLPGPEFTLGAQLPGRRVALAVRAPGGRPALGETEHSLSWGGAFRAPVLEVLQEGDLPLSFETVLAVGPRTADGEAAWPICFRS